jgi:hypothetical protein
MMVTIFMVARVRRAGPKFNQESGLKRKQPPDKRCAGLGELFSDEDKDAGDQGQNREQDAGAHPGETNDADDDQVNREQEHANIFGEVHGGMVRGDGSLCTQNRSRPKL